MMSKTTRLFIAKNKAKKGLPITDEERELLDSEKKDYEPKSQPEPQKQVGTIGLYRSGKRLVSTRLKKSDIPKFCRLMFIKTQYKQAGDNRPDYIGFFVEGGTYQDALNIKRPYATLKAQNPPEE